MLCVSAEDALAAATAAAVASDKMRSLTLGGSIQRALRKMAGSGGSRAGPASCSADDSSIGSAKREGGRRASMQRYRSQLEQEVKKLQRQLQDEIDLHLALADAIANNAALILNPSIKLPDKAQELMISIASLEIDVSKLEKDLNLLHYELSYIRNERQRAENNPGCLPSTSGRQPSTTYVCTGNEDASALGDLRLGDSQSTRSIQEGLSAELEGQLNDTKHCEDREMIYPDRLLERHRHVPLTRLLGLRDDEMQKACSLENEGKEDGKIDALQFGQSNLKKNSMSGNLQNNLNQLSGEMVRLMTDIFLHLSASSQITPKAPFDSSSSAECLSSSTLTYLSDSSIIASMLHSPSVDLNQEDATVSEIRNFDPYKANGKEARRDIGCYCSAVEVSWMYVGNEQLEYASGALKKFRSLVEQLSEVDPACMNCDERLAFWINLYNALIMHAYLAYGVPENDFKLFSLMQQACYTVGGLSISAAEIEFVILKMKAPVHRPQLSLMLALHKFKTSERLKKYSVDDTEPLVLFVLSCGMFSSPAVRIFTAENVRRELKESMRNYIRASVGINDKGELTVPKLLQSYAKGVVEDSLFADWICRHLTLDQISAIQDTSSSQTQQRLLGVRSFTVIPFNTKFRYLFLFDHARS